MDYNISDVYTRETAATPFFYASRNICGPGIGDLNRYADVWKIAKMVQFLPSRDESIATIGRDDTINYADGKLIAYSILIG